MQIESMLGVEKHSRPCSIAVLGPMLVAGREGLQLRDRTVLGVLVARNGITVTVDEIAYALWGEGGPASHRKVIQGSVMRLRRELGEASIRTVDAGYRLAVDPATVDVHLFERAIVTARERLASGYADRAAREVRDALVLWRGTPFVELDEWTDAEAERVRLGALRDGAVDLLLDAMVRAGHHAAAAAEAGRLVEDAPYREPRWALWARALYADGRQAEALRALQRLRAVLRDDLGVLPCAEVEALELAMLQHDPSLGIPAAVRRDVRCPWRGLLPYEPADAAEFFGRDTEIDACLKRFSARRRLVVVGRSGSGKSSLLRAGLVPRLLASGARVDIIVPGRHPLDALSVVDDNCVVVVDQAEEVLTQCLDPDERTAFFDRLAQHDAGVVIVVRADMMDELTVFGGFGAVLERGVFVLRPLDENGLRAAVELPAKRASLQLQPGLVELLLEECRGQPGVLPLVSHVLAETWRRVEGNTLTVDGYTRSGGIRAAIATSAERVYEASSDSQRLQMRRLFRRLVRFVGEEPVGARALRRVADDVLVERLLAARLVTVSEGGELQLAHEQLARHWPRLTEWIAEDRAGERLLHHLSAEVSEWVGGGRPSGLLYRDVRLDAAVSWAADHPDDLEAFEREFLDESQRAAQASLRDARRTNGRLRMALAASVVLLAVSITGTVFALHQRTTAAHARDATQRARDFSEALRVGLLAQAVDDPSVALALAAESLSIDDSPASRTQALEVFGRFKALLSIGKSPPGSSWPASVPTEAGGNLASSSDGQLLAQAGPHDVTIRESASGSVLGVIADLPTEPNALAFDADGGLLAGGLSEEGFADEGTTIVWNVPQRLEVARFDAGHGQVWSHWFEPSGHSVYSYGADGVHRWDLTASHALIRTDTGDPTSFRAGDLLLSMADDSVAPWIAEACRLAGRPLSREDWSTYLGAARYEPSC